MKLNVECVIRRINRKCAVAIGEINKKDMGSAIDFPDQFPIYELLFTHICSKIIYSTSETIENFATFYHS